MLGTLGACTGGGDDPPATGAGTAPPVTGGPQTSSSAPTVSPRAAVTTGVTTTSPTPPVKIPEAARAHTKAGAEAFVKFFVEQSNVASMTADTSILPPLSDPGCKSCAALQSQIVDLKARGHHYSSAPVSASQTTAVTGSPKGQQFVRLQLTENRVEVVDANGRHIATDPKGHIARTVSLIWKGGRWKVFGIAQ
ncbi:DUF6318 family protein [Pedococcus dokdonensis]|uniref:DUF6318 family protein n=1 Tax=Pedococcus dokdonensis TaxID=443156 RepID=UPI0022B257E5|nr:DUF6318 family protein [Pedococcus dokdonensis]